MATGTYNQSPALTPLPCAITVEKTVFAPLLYDAALKKLVRHEVFFIWLSLPWQDRLSSFFKIVARRLKRPQMREHPRGTKR